MCKISERGPFFVKQVVVWEELTHLPNPILKECGRQFLQGIRGGAHSPDKIGEAISLARKRRQAIQVVL